MCFPITIGRAVVAADKPRSKACRGWCAS